MGRNIWVFCPLVLVLGCGGMSNDNSDVGAEQELRPTLVALDVPVVKAVDDDMDLFAAAPGAVATADDSHGSATDRAEPMQVASTSGRQSASPQQREASAARAASSDVEDMTFSERSSNRGQSVEERFPVEDESMFNPVALVAFLNAKAVAFEMDGQPEQATALRQRIADMPVPRKRTATSPALTNINEPASQRAYRPMVSAVAHVRRMCDRARPTQCPAQTPCALQRQCEQQRVLVAAVVSNHGDFDLDQVEVTVHFIGADGRPVYSKMVLPERNGEPLRLAAGERLRVGDGDYRLVESDLRGWTTAIRAEVTGLRFK